MPLNNPLRYECPTCAALVGERCVELETGDIMVQVHGARQMLAVPRALDRVREGMAAKPKLTDRVAELADKGSINSSQDG